MTNFINTINNIPENFGWFFVGILATLCVIMGVKLIGLAVKIWREYHEAEGEI